MKNWIGPLMLMAAIAGFFGFAQVADAQGTTTPKFKADILPILKAKCVACHTGPQAAEKLRLDTYENLMKGGEHGKVVKPGDPRNSRLMQFIRGTKTPRMPMNMAPLSTSQTNKIDAWIKAGAKKN